MKKETKYPWDKDNPPEINKHSTVKHGLIRDYIQWYIETLMSNQIIPKLELTIVDGFSGGGRYTPDPYLKMENNGESIIYGSPIKIIEAVECARATINIGRNSKRTIKANFIFLDNDPKAVDCLTQTLYELSKELPYLNNVDNAIFIRCGIYETYLKEHIIPILKKNPRKRMILILDQYGYKDVDFISIATLMSSYKNVEIILTFNIDSLTSFLSERYQPALHNIGLHGHIPWSALPEVRTKKENEEFLQRIVGDAIRKASCAKYSNMFFIKSEKGPNSRKGWGYWLVHLSNHFKAHDNMKSLHYDYSNFSYHALELGVFELGYSAYEDKNHIRQCGFGFTDADRKITEEEIALYFAKKITELAHPVEIKSFIEAHSTFSNGTAKHMENAINLLHKEKDIIVMNKNRKERKTSVKSYNKDDVIEINPQKKLNFI